MSQSFFDSDDTILNEKLNPTLKARARKIFLKCLPFITGFFISAGKTFYKSIPVFIVIKLLCILFNIHFTITF